MKIEDNHYTYRIETKDPNGGSLDFIDIDTVEPLRCAYDVQDELNLETNEHIKRVEEIVLDANSTEFWYVDEARTSNTHLVCYFEEVELMASKDHPMVDTNRSVFEYGKINSNEHQNTNFICTHVMDNGVSRIYMSIDKETFEFATFNNETIKHFISNNPVTVWYALRYEVIIPRSLSKGHLLTLSGQTDVTLTTNNEQAKLPIMKFNVGDTQYTLDTNPIHIDSTQEGTQIRNIVLEGNTPINYARGNGVNTTEATSNTRYDFEPFYDGQVTIQGTVEGGYVSAKLYGDTMVNIAKPYGETPLLTATNASTLCDDLLGANEEGIVLADGEITEGRIVGDSVKGVNPTFVDGRLDESNGETNDTVGICCHSDRKEVPKGTFTFTTGYAWTKVAYYTSDGSFIKCDVIKGSQVTSTPPSNASYVIYGTDNVLQPTDGFTWKYEDGTDVYETIQSVVNPTVYSVNENLFDYESFKTQEAVGNYVNIPIKLKKDTVYHIISDYNEWNGSFAYMCLAKVENGSYTNLLNLIDSNNPNTYGKGFATGNHDNYVIRAISTDRDIIISKATKIGIFEGEYSSHEIAPHKHTQATFPYTLNKLPNGVADYIDVVNKVHVQRVGEIVLDGTHTFTYYSEYSSGYNYCYIMRLTNNNLGQARPSSYGLCDKIQYQINSNFPWTTDVEFILVSGNQLVIKLSKDKLNSNNTVSSLTNYLASNPITVLYELATPIYTPLTDEEIAQLPLSAYSDGYVNLSSDQLMPSFEFRMKASNRYQVDMLETGYYYLNAPVGNVKLGTANVDVQQMPCIVKVDNVGASDSKNRLGFDGGESIYIVNPTGSYGYWIDNNTGELNVSSAPEKQFLSDFIEINTSVNSIVIVDDGLNKDVSFWDENKKFITRRGVHNNRGIYKASLPNVPFKFIRIGTFDSSDLKARAIINPITLAKLPSHRIPTSFTQGMASPIRNLIEYWEGIKEAQVSMYRTYNGASVKDRVNLSKCIQLNRIEYGNTIVEDELDIATGKLTKRVGIMTLDGSENWIQLNNRNTINDKYVNSFQLKFIDMANANFKTLRGVRCSRHPYQTSIWNLDKEGLSVGSTDIVLALYKEKACSLEVFKQYLANNPLTIYYELEVPEISYIDLPLNTLRTLDVATTLQVDNQSIASCLLPQVKPSHLTYPVPSLVGNRTYTVVHNRKNITGSTKPIELNLGGTVVQLNDASSKTLVKTPSTLAHSNLIFIGGESTVDHIMVLDGDWTNKPIEYFENMMGHDTDAIITIIGNGQIDDVPEQYLW